ARLHGPPRGIPSHEVPLARGRRRLDPRLPRGDGLDRRRPRDGTAPQDAAYRGRAVPPRVDTHRLGRTRPARELPRARRGGRLRKEVTRLTLRLGRGA